MMFVLGQQCIREPRRYSEGQSTSDLTLMKPKGEGLVEFLNFKYSKKRTQDMKKYYHDAGQFYWFKVKDYKIIKNKKFNYFYLDKKMSVDVDTKEDLEILKILHKNKIKSKQ